MKMCTQRNLNCLEIACENRHNEFIIAMADMQQCQVANADDGNTLLHYLIKLYHIDSKCFEELLQFVAVKFPESISIQNSAGETPVSLLLALRSYKVFSCLQILFGVSPEATRAELNRLQGASSRQSTLDLSLLLEEVNLETVTVHLLGTKAERCFCQDMMKLLPPLI